MVSKLTWIRHLKKDREYVATHHTSSEEEELDVDEAHAEEIVEDEMNIDVQTRSIFIHHASIFILHAAEINIS